MGRHVMPALTRPLIQKKDNRDSGTWKSVFEHAAPRHHTSTYDARLLRQLGDQYGGIFGNQIERIFPHRRLDGLEDVVPGQRKGAADDDQFGIEDVNQPRNVFAEFLTDLFHNLDAQGIFPVDGFDDLAQHERPL